MKALARKRNPGEEEARQLVVLLAAGANANLEVVKGQPLIVACIHRTYPLTAIRSLLAHGADPNATATLKRSEYKLGDGQTALAIAACSLYRGEAGTVVKKLVEAGADVNLKDSQGNTVLDHLFAVMDYYRDLYGWSQEFDESATWARMHFFFNSAGPYLELTKFLVGNGALLGTMSREETERRFSEIVEHWNRCVDWDHAYRMRAGIEGDS